MKVGDKVLLITNSYNFSNCYGHRERIRIGVNEISRFDAEHVYLKNYIHELDSNMTCKYVIDYGMTNIFSYTGPHKHWAYCLNKEDAAKFLDNLLQMKRKTVKGLPVVIEAKCKVRPDGKRFKNNNEYITYLKDILND